MATRRQLGTGAAAIKADKGTSKEPDVVDVSPAIAVEGRVRRYYFEPYKVQTWNEIPTSMKDPGGRWYGDYYGVISFGTNTKVVKNPPKSWADLQKPEYKGQVAIDGNPGRRRRRLRCRLRAPRSQWAARSTTSCRASSSSST